MELSSHDGEIPIPINSSYGGGHGHMIHHDHQTAATHNHNIIPTNSTNPQMPSINNNNGVPIPTPISSTTALELEDQNHSIIVPFKRGAVKYRECLKNHAAVMGGNATDGCGEFMPSGEEGTLEALTCSACNCHRNFHRKEVEGECNSSPCDNNYFHTTNRNISGRKVIVSHHHHKNVFGYPAAAAGTLITPRGAPPPPPQHHHMIMSYNMGSFASESDEQEDGGGGGGGVVLRPVPHQMVKKRFRTKFTQEQKEKMLDFAEKVGWKIQKQEEAVVQQFCQEIGVRRRVLKVWMHNNKHNLAKKNPSSSSNVQNPI